MDRLNWIGLLNAAKTRLKMTQLGYKIMASDLSVDEIMPLIETLTMEEKMVLSFVAPSPVEYRIKAATNYLISERRDKLRSAHRAGQIKEYLMSLPHWSTMIELTIRCLDEMSDEDYQMNNIIKRTAYESIYLTDPVVSKLIRKIQNDSLSINQVATRIHYLGPYEMQAIFAASEHRDVLDQKVIEVLEQACNMACDTAKKILSYKKDSIKK